MAKTSSANFTDGLNIGLMVAALVPAIFLPFELFLFVYAVLGPLHYLTEINWLHKKQYFTTRRNDYIPLLVIIGIIGLLPFSGSSWKYYVPLLIFIAFFASFGLMFFESPKKKLIFASVCAVIGYLLFISFYTNFRIIFYILLPTVVHVFIFTGAFIMLGSLRSKSWLGMGSVIVFLACAAITLFVSVNFNFSGVSDYIANSYGPFKSLNRVLIEFFNIIHVEQVKADFQIPVTFKEKDVPVFFSENGVRIMRFIAFAYTYHYLNWFSKTSVIQWHNTKFRNLMIIMLIWVISVAIYIKDYRMGLKWLYLLSFAHVALEFPLNHRSFVKIKKHIMPKRPKL